MLTIVVSTNTTNTPTACRPNTSRHNRCTTTAEPTHMSRPPAPDYQTPPLPHPGTTHVNSRASRSTSTRPPDVTFPHPQPRDIHDVAVHHGHEHQPVDEHQHAEPTPFLENRERPPTRPASRGRSAWASTSTRSSMSRPPTPDYQTHAVAESGRSGSAGSLGSTAVSARRGFGRDVATPPWSLT
jgi:hypothetical protein